LDEALFWLFLSDDFGELHCGIMFYEIMMQRYESISKILLYVVSFGGWIGYWLIVIN